MAVSLSLLRQARAALCRDDVDGHELASALKAAGVRPALGFHAPSSDSWELGWTPSENEPDRGDLDRTSLGLLIADSLWRTAYQRSLDTHERASTVVLAVIKPDDPDPMERLIRDGWALGSRGVRSVDPAMVAQAAANALRANRTHTSGVLLWVIDDEEDRFEADGVWGGLWTALRESRQELGLRLLPSLVSGQRLGQDPEGLLEDWRSNILLPLRRTGTPAVVLTDNQFRPTNRFGKLGERLALLLSSALPNARVLLASARDAGDWLPRRVGAVVLSGRPPKLSVESASVETIAETVRSARRGGPLPVDPFKPWRRGLGRLVGECAAMQLVYDDVTRATSGDRSVLLLGETGTGKSALAQEIHNRSTRSTQRFCALEMTTISENLIESELFGHASGSFSGAEGERKGLFEHASGGTLFLDEVGELAPAAQAKLLRAVEEGKVRPVGSNKDVQVDVRIIAATLKELPAEVDAGRFREDLYYRLADTTLLLPPLRDRGDDVLILAALFLPKPPGVGLEGQLLSHSWPGNVRELRSSRAERLPPATPRNTPPRGDGLAAPFHTFALLWPPLAKSLGPTVLTHNRDAPVETYRRLVRALDSLELDVGTREREQARVLLGWTVEDDESGDVANWLDRAWQRTCRTTGRRTSRPQVEGDLEIWTTLLAPPRPRRHPSPLGHSAPSGLGALLTPVAVRAVAAEWMDIDWSDPAREGSVAHFLFDVWDADPHGPGRGNSPERQREAGRRLYDATQADVSKVPDVVPRLDLGFVKDLEREIDRRVRRTRAKKDTVWRHAQRAAGNIASGAREPPKVQTDS